MNGSTLCTALAALGLTTLAAAATATPVQAANARCEATSHALAPIVVELYTSEGCNSCPPADRWLSRTLMKPRSADQPPLVALAFHVDYWDYLGWKDIFAQPAFAERQQREARAAGAGVYTPQVFVNTREDRSWTQGTAVASGPSAAAGARFEVTAEWSNDAVVVSSRLLDGAPARLRHELIENALSTQVKAGENKGETLRHDAVVRGEALVTPQAGGRFRVELALPRALNREKARIHVIAEDARGQPLAAATLACAPT